MNTAGGFILEANTIAESSSSSIINSNDNDDRNHPHDDSITVRKLTSKQEIRLMNYLDDAFMQVNRGYNKRHNIKTSSVPDIQSFLEVYEEILILIASIPPIGPSASLLVSYLLRYTNEILDGIAGYEIGNVNDSSSNINLLAQDLQRVVDNLNILDRVWSCVLRGQMVDFYAVKRNIYRKKDESDDLFPRIADMEGQSRHAKELENVNVNVNRETGRYPPIQPNQSEKEGRSIIGSKGFATVAQTHRIRLRNLVALGKENLFTWMRVQLDVPLPPKVDVERDAELDEYFLPGKRSVDDDMQASINVNGTASVVKEEDDEGGDLEETGTNVGLDNEDSNTKENSHYDDLFARKIDPDASDEDDEDSDADRNNKANGKHPISPSSSSPIREQDAKRSRQDPHTIRETSQEDAESIATFSGTATVMKWDIKFARLFSYTLRCLSDIQEYSNHRDATRQEADDAT